MTLEEIKKIAMPACQEFKVKRLDLFGSLARGEHAAESDVDLLVGSGVERKFEIIGEALNRVSRDNPTILDKIREHRNIVSFRNIPRTRLRQH